MHRYCHPGESEMAVYKYVLIKGFIIVLRGSYYLAEQKTCVVLNCLDNKDFYLACDRITNLVHTPKLRLQCCIANTCLLMTDLSKFLPVPYVDLFSHRSSVSNMCQ